MNRTIFYSWQSDTPSKTNRSLIRAALDTVVKNLDQETELEDAERWGWELDHDTKGVPGSPELVNTILEKIEKCAVFVPDLTFVGTADDQSKIANPNVLIELGYAAKAVGFDRFVMVMNVHFGSPAEHMPFDLRHRRFPVTYSLAPDASAEIRKQTKVQLAKELEKAIRQVLHEEVPITTDGFVAIEPVFKSSSYLRDGEQLAEISEPGFKDVKPVWRNGPQAFVRLLPTRATTPQNPHDLRRLMSNRPYLVTVGRSQAGFMEPNKFGAVIFDVAKSGALRTFTQVFQSGEIWGLQAIPGDAVRQKGLPMPYLRDRCTAALDSFVQFSLHHLKNQPPFRAIIGVSDIEGFGVLGRRQPVGKFFQPEIIVDREIATSAAVAQLVGEFDRLVHTTCGA